MAISRRFVVKKDAHEETITYMEYEKLRIPYIGTDNKKHI